MSRTLFKYQVRYFYPEGPVEGALHWTLLGETPEQAKADAEKEVVRLHEIRDELARVSKSPSSLEYRAVNCGSFVEEPAQLLGRNGEVL